MIRYLWILPFCLILRGQSVFQDAIPMVSGEKEFRPSHFSKVAEGPELARQQLVRGLALATQAGFPASIPWEPMYQIGTQGLYPLENILIYQPTLFLHMCQEKYDREVHSYTYTFRKQERIGNQLQDPEKIKVCFRERPFSVHFEWLEGARLAKRVLYVEGENNGKVLVRPNLPVLGRFVLHKDVDGSEARKSGRYTINESGLRLATQRTMDTMKAADARGKLFVRYEGEVEVAQLNNRVCYKFVRTPYDPPEEEGVNELVLYIDKEHWLQVGSILRDRDGQVIAEYYFRDLRINPEIPQEQFTPKSL